MRLEPWHRNLIAIWIGQMLSGMAINFMLPFIPLYVQHLGVSNTAEVARWAGLIGASAAVSMGVMQPIWGGVADRWGRKPMLIRSLIGGGFTVGLMGFATSPEQLAVLRFLQGGVTGSVPAANALVSASIPRARLGFALGLLQLAWFVGASFGPLLGGFVADTVGYRFAFYISAALSFLGGLIVVAFVREEFEGPPAGASRPSVMSQSRSLLAIAAFRIVLSVVVMIQLANAIVGPVLTLYVADLGQGASAATMAGLMLAATGALSAVTAVVIGRLGDRFGYDGIVRVCLLGAALAYLPQAFVQDVWQLLGLRMLLGLFLGGLMPTVNALVAAAVPADRRGAAFGLTETAVQIAFFAGPLTGAAIVSAWGVRAAFIATGLVFGLGWVWASLSFGRVRIPRVPAGSSER